MRANDARLPSGRIMCAKYYTLSLLQSVVLSLPYESVNSETSDGCYVPFSKISADYPDQARNEDIDGYCVVGFAVNKNGAVRSPQIVECEPTGYFEDSVLEAAAKFKYPPHVVDGIIYEVQSVHIRFWFYEPRASTHSSFKPPANCEHVLKKHHPYERVRACYPSSRCLVE